MPIIAKNTGVKSFELCPSGAQQAVCCDVVDLGMVTTKYANEYGSPKVQHKIRVVWQSAEAMSDGRPYLVQKQYTLSLHEKAILRQDLESWRGRPFTDDEMHGFDVERLIGANCILNVVHNPGSKGGMFANVMSVMPLMKGQNKTVISDYVRQCDRVKEAQHAPDIDSGGEDIAPDYSDIPF